MDEMMKMIRDIQSKVEDVGPIRKLCEETNKTIDEIREEVSSLKIDNETNKNDIDTLKAEIKELKVRVREQEQYSRKNNLIIHGVPNTIQDEDLEGLINSMAKKLDVNIQSNDIAAVHRLPARKNGESLPIIVRFNKFNVKAELLNQVKKRKPEGKYFGLEPSHPIFFNEHLLKEVSDIWMAAKELQESSVIAQATCRDGKIKIRKTSTCMWNRIYDMNQLQQIYNQWEENNNNQSGYNETTNRKRNADERSPEKSPRTTSNEKNIKKKHKFLQDESPRSTTKNLTIKQSRLERFRVARGTINSI